MHLKKNQCTFTSSAHETIWITQIYTECSFGQIYTQLKSPIYSICACNQNQSNKEESTKSINFHGDELKITSSRFPFVSSRNVMLQSKDKRSTKSATSNEFERHTCEQLRLITSIQSEVCSPNPLTTSLIPNSSLNIIREIPDWDGTHTTVNKIAI